MSLSAQKNSQHLRSSYRRATRVLVVRMGGNHPECSVFSLFDVRKRKGVNRDWLQELELKLLTRENNCKEKLHFSFTFFKSSVKGEYPQPPPFCTILAVLAGFRGFV